MKIKRERKKEKEKLGGRKAKNQPGQGDSERGRNGWWE